MNRNSIFNSTTNVVFIRQTGLFWFHLSAGIPNNTKAYFCLKGVSVPAIIYKSNTVFSFDQSTFDSLQWVPNQSQLSISTKYDLYSSINREVAWFGVRIDSLMSPLIAFSAARNTTQIMEENSFGTKIIYDYVTLNEGNAWIAKERTFIAPLNGYYIFAYSIPGLGFKEFGMEIIVDDVVIHRTCFCESKHNGIDSIRGSTVLHLLRYEEVKFSYQNEKWYPFSDSNLLMHIQGFLYRPITKRPVIWSVYSVDHEYRGKLEKFSYHFSRAHPKNIWHSNTKQVKIPCDGTYVIDLNSYMCGITWHGNGKLEIHAVLNGNPIIVLKIPNNVDDCISRSRSALHFLRKGDRLWVTIPVTTSGGYFANSNGYQSFMGYLLYE